MLGLLQVRFISKLLPSDALDFSNFKQISISRDALNEILTDGVNKVPIKIKSEKFKVAAEVFNSYLQQCQSYKSLQKFLSSEENKCHPMAQGNVVWQINASRIG